MMRMLQNECFKMFRQKKLYIFMLILALMNSIVVLAYKSGGNMRTVIVTPNAQSLPLALLNETAQFMIIFIAIYIADIIADEYRNGTLKLTLLRPVGRIQWLNSKILALLVFSAVMIAFQIISAYITGIAALGWGSSTVYAGVTYAPGKGVLLTVLLSFSLILPYVAYGLIVVLIAILSTNMIMTIGISIGVMTVGQYFDAFASIKNFSIVHQMYYFHENFLKSFSWNNIIESVISVLLYFTLFYVGSIKTLKKKDILS